jgi:hypothetical protein
MSVKKDSKRDPMKTKTGKTRLGPLNLEQLNKLMEHARPKERAKIQNRIRAMTK